MIYLDMLLCGVLLFFKSVLVKAEITLKEVFRDDFDGRQVDLNKWYLADMPSSVGDELQYFHPDNAVVANGTLNIIASYVGDKKNSSQMDAFWTKTNYTSGMLYTMNKFHFRYGEVEWRAKVAPGKGLITGAFLFSPMCTPVSTNCQSYWPPSVTVIGAKGESTHTVQMKAFYQDKKPVLLKKEYSSVQDFSRDFHIYKLTWTETYLGWFVDDQEVFNVTVANQIPSISMQLVMKLAVGGPFSGSYPDKTTHFPAAFIIDYVVVRQYPNESSSIAPVQNATSPVLPAVLGSLIPLVVLLSAGIGLSVFMYRRRRVLFEGSMRKASTDTEFSTASTLNYIADWSNDADTNDALVNYVRLLEIPLANIQTSNIVLGRGECGIVRKGIARGLSCLSCPVEVAVKTVRDRSNPYHMRQLVEEVKIMSKAGRHLNICNLLGVVLKGETLLLLEFSRYGCLLRYLQKHRGHWFYNHTTDTGKLLPYDETEEEQLQCETDEELRNVQSEEKFDGRILSTQDLMHFAFQVSRGMEYLTSRSIIHRDLAARNVLVCDGRVLKVSDFGMAKQMEEYVQLDHQAVLPVRWMPPESITDRVFCEKSDVWSFGVVMWEIFSLGELPYSNAKMDLGYVVELVASLRNGKHLERPVTCPTAIYGVMLECWAVPPADRPDFSQLTQSLRQVLGNDSVSPYLSLDICYEEFNDQHRALLDAIVHQPDCEQHGSNDSGGGDR